MGEIVALVSLPDYDPNNPVDALEKDRINRINVGVFEMGSTFKALTVAMALDSGKYNINSTFDARSGLRYGRFTIGDYHPTRRVLSTPEVFVHSSNIGTARMALGIGVEGHKAFLRKMGQLTPRDGAAGKRPADRSATLGRAQHHDHRLRPWPRRRAAASLRGRCAGERRRAYQADIPEAQ